MTKLKIVFAVIVTVLSVFGCFYITSLFIPKSPEKPPPTNNTKSVLTVLRSENLDFLVRRRQMTQVLVMRTSTASWLDWVPYVGPMREALKDDGVLTANVRIYYGFDLKKLSTGSINDANDRFVVTLPEPEMLDYSVDLDSLKFVALKTGIVTRLGNVFRDETLKDELLREITKSVNEFVSTPGAVPTKQEIISELAGFERILSESHGVTVKFQ